MQDLQANKLPLVSEMRSTRQPQLYGASSKTKATTVCLRLQHRHSEDDMRQGQLAAEPSLLVQAFGQQLIDSEAHTSRGAVSCQVRGTAGWLSWTRLRSGKDYDLLHAQ